MEYSTYWSMLEAPTHSVKSNTVGLYIAIGAAILWILVKTIKKNKGDGEKTILLWSTASFSVIGLGIYIMMTFAYKDNSDAQILKMLNSPETPVIEGIVSNFQRTYSRSEYNNTVTTESFTVDSILFSYNDDIIERFKSFSKTYNNVIFDGQIVRITYGQGYLYDTIPHDILKLEIAK